VPDAILDIVGARPPPDVLALGNSDGVAVHADVPDVVPFLERARVAVVPLRIGSGSRLKALEAMAAGRPVVGTAIGVGGLEARPGRDLIVAVDAGAFADQVARCLADRELAMRLGRQGRALVEERYCWDRIGAEYAALLERRAAA
jgi:glycosyltransferase involved in cell wall biosynthesis